MSDYKLALYKFEVELCLLPMSIMNTPIFLLPHINTLTDAPKLGSLHSARASLRITALEGALSVTMPKLISSQVFQVLKPSPTRPFFPRTSRPIYASIPTRKQNRLPAAYYRGGTSRAIIFSQQDLPKDRREWE